jgi:hypothetical protein
MAIGIKIAVMVILALILISLASGIFYLAKDDGKTDRAVKALTFRVVLSLLLFFVLVIGYLTGNISPHGA